MIHYLNMKPVSHRGPIAARINPARCSNCMQELQKNDPSTPPWQGQEELSVLGGILSRVGMFGISER